MINAVRWVIDNAENIGADISKISLMGFSSGAALAQDAAMTPQLENKIFNVIPFSGLLSTFQTIKIVLEIVNIASI